MEEYTGYLLIKDVTLELLETAVGDLLQLGWLPLGGPFRCQDYFDPNEDYTKPVTVFVQAMVGNE